MTDAVRVSLGLGLSLLLGAGVLRRLGVGPRGSVLSFFAESYLAGTFATGAFVAAWLALGAPLAAGTPIFLVAAATLLLRIVPAPRREGGAPPIEPRRFPVAERALFAAVLALGLLAVAASADAGNARPIVEGDEAVIWSAKAKALYGANRFGGTFAERMSDPYQPWARDYPLLNPLLQVWAFACAGRVTHVANRLPSQATLLVLLLAAAAALRRRARPALAAALLLLLLPATSSPTFCHAIYADPMVALGALLALDAWLRLHEGPAPGRAFLLSLGLAYAAASKHEGALLLLAVAIGAAAGRIARGRDAPPVRGPKAAGILAAPALVVAATWAVNLLAGVAARNEFLRPDAAGRGVLDRLVEELPVRLGPILAEVARQGVLGVEWTNALVAIFLALVLFAPRQALRGEVRAPTLVLLLVLLGFAASYVATPGKAVDHIGYSLRRVTYQILPAVALWIGIVLGRLEPRLSARSADGPPAGGGGG